MIHIILTILKIIGIILLSIIGLVLLILLCVLFAPLKYKGHVVFDGDNIKFNVKAKYLFGAVRFYVRNKEKQTKYSLKILFITLFGTDKKPKKKKNKSKKSDTKSKKSTDNVIDDDLFDEDIDVKENIDIKDKENISSEDIKQDEKNTESVESTENVKITENVDNTESVENTQNVDDNASKKKFGINGLLNKIKKIKKSIMDFINKLRNIKQKKDEYKEFLTTEESKRMFKELKGIGFDLLKKVLPYKIKGRIKFGLESPDKTGQALGFMAILNTYIAKDVNIDADFENSVFEGELYFKGKIRVITLVAVAIKVYKIKRLREFINFVRK